MVFNTRLKDRGRDSHSPSNANGNLCHTRGFTLLEILIVVIIMGILAALVVPKVSNAANGARETTLRDDLRYMRTQIMVYRAQHNGVSPGYPEGDLDAQPTLEAFTEQLTMYSNVHGQTSSTPSAEFKYGPYLRRIPVNPLTGQQTVWFVDADQPFPNEPIGEGGWLYQPSTGTLAADLPGLDRAGTAYFDY